MDTIKAWQCIGCGKLEAPQNCIGVCQDRRVELVYASEYAVQAAELARVQGQRTALQALVQRVAALEASGAPSALAALRDEARTLLAAVEHQDEAASTPPASAPSASADAAGPLRDRRGSSGAQKPRLVRQATLFVR